MSSETKLNDNCITIAFIDLETTGLPKTISFSKYHPYESTQYYDTSRIVQIALVVCKLDKDLLSLLLAQEDAEIKDNTLVVPTENKIEAYDILDSLSKNYPFIEVIAKHDYIIKPDGFVIQNEKIHDITQTVACFAGLPFLDAISRLENDLEKCSTLIAHNIIFDKNILLSELHRYGKFNLINKIKSMKEFCTSKGTKHIVKIQYNRVSLKQPKLSELYYYLFNKYAENLHNALVDISVTILCFLELLAKKHLNVNILV
jgi:DNA polymerase III epsilon subunit-like protein